MQVIDTTHEPMANNSFSNSMSSSNQASSATQGSSSELARKAYGSSPLKFQKTMPSPSSNSNQLSPHQPTPSLSYKDLKGDQSSEVIQDLDGNDLPSIKNFAVEIIQINMNL